MKNSVVTIDNETVQKIKRGNRRKDRVDAGFNDGRFTTQVVETKKSYSRKEKHKKIEW